jgi:hypothetical protein
VKLSLAVEDRPYHAGEWVRGRVEVQEGGHSRGLTVSLLQRDRTADYGGVVRRVDGPELHQGDLQAPASFEFSLQIPADAPPSYSDTYGAIYWEVDAKSDERGIDTHARSTIVVAPPER